jgi:hypothetical protein
VRAARIVGPVAVVLALGACAVASGGGVPTDPPSASDSAASSSAGAATAASSATGAPTTQQWCASYATLTSVLSQTASDTAGAQTALQALERFDLLWGIADNMGILTPDEVAANQRSVASYRAVMALVASGSTAGSTRLAAARATLTTQTTSDHALLSSSAGTVVGLCGAPTRSPSS